MLVEKMKAKAVAVRMCLVGALTDREQDLIYRCSTRPDAANELLDLLAAKSSEVFDCFLFALLRTDQKKLFRLLAREEYHVRRIGSHRKMLLNSLNARTVAVCMCQVHALKDSELELICHCSTGSDAANELLNLLAAKSSQVFNWFLFALLETDQKNLFHVLTGERHIQTIERHRKKLLDSLNAEAVAIHMHQVDALTDGERELICQCSTRREAASKLLDLLAAKPSEAFDRFLHALHETDQKNLFHLLTREACSFGYMEVDVDNDDDDDVPDVPNVVVKLTEPKFYDDHSFEAYPMYRKERGVACIINVYQTAGLNNREGTHADYYKLVELFRQMHFIVRGFNDKDDLTVEGILKKVKDTAGELVDGLKKRQQCYVLFILSHGSMDPKLGEVLYGCDGQPLPKTDVIQALNHDNLKNTPRLVYFVSCRGDKKWHLEEADLVKESKADLVKESEADLIKVPSKHFIVGFPCEKDYVSWMDPKRGTRYVRCLVDLFMNEAHNTDVETLLNQVNHKLKDFVKKGNRKHQIAVYRSTLERKLYLFPGRMA
jgi:hypothetical protein